MTNNKPFSLKIIPFIVVYSILTAISASVNIAHFNLEINGHILTPSDICIFSTMLSTIWIIINMLTLKRQAYNTALILFIAHIIVIIIGYVFTHDINTALGFLSVIFMYIISSVIMYYIKRIENKEAELYKVAYTDALTNTPNRFAFNELIESLTNNKFEVKKTPFALVFINLNEIIHINDTMGREFGDQMITEVVSRWKYVMRNNDFIARIADGEFALLIQDYLNEKELFEHISEFEHTLRHKITVEDKSFFVSASFGVSRFPEDSLSTEDLMRYANIALQNTYVKNNTKICVFEKSMIDDVEYELSIDTMLRDALNNDRFKLVFQPQYDISTKKLRGFETLLRMSDNDGKPISPGIFIPMAEKNGLIVEIDCYVLRKAMETFKPLIEKYDSDIIISVNISAIHLVQNTFVFDVKSALDATGFPAKNLELEITESVFISSLETTAENLKLIKSLGIQIALDDFGTGYASLSYLTQLPIDLLKIDKTFVDGLKDKNDFTDFVAAIISMGHLLHFDVISEGVEFENQLSILRELNCDFVQGFIWGKPMDIMGVSNLMSELAS